jgi:hypothetical protein
MTSTENFMKSYAYLAAQKLDADYSAVSYSGYGIVSGYTSSGEKVPDCLVPDYYAMTAKPYSYAKPWDFERRRHDVVVVNLGTNDNTYVSADKETRSVEFTEGYFDFLTVIREKNPDAYIICTLGIMGCEELYPCIEEAVSRFAEEDDRIMCYKSEVQKQSDGYGSDWHPSAITQQKSAYVLADKICTALGIESDKVGLDAAADGKYGLVINEESGANAADYLGYDKSYWINTVTGGNKSSDIRACVSGISLTPGTYTLRFVHTAGRETDISVSVCSAGAPERIYHEGSFAAGADKALYEETFKVSSGDEDCSVFFDIGGADYLNVTLSELSLVKISG